MRISDIVSLQVVTLLRMCNFMMPALPGFQMVSSVLEYGGQKVRGNDLFGNDTPIAMTKKFLKGLQVIICLGKLSYTYGADC